MKATNQSPSWIKHSDLFLFLIYGLFCCFFFLERTSFLDNPFTIFKLINDESLFVNANRYPAVIVQLLPLLAIKLGLPLKVVMFMHSLSYLLFHGVLFYIIRFSLKDKAMSWMLLLTLIIPVAHTFFWNNNELFLGLSALCLWLALMRKKKWTASLATSIVLAWIHPLLLVILVFIIVSNFVVKDIPTKLILANGILYKLSYFLKSFFFPNYYDTAKSGLLLNNLSEYNFSPSSIFGLINSIDYWPIVLCCLVSICLLLLNKSRILAILLIGFIVCFLILTGLTEGDSSYVFYNEGNYRVLFFVSAYSIAVTELPKKLFWLKYGIAVMAIIGFIRIGLQSSFYTDRIEWYQSTAGIHDRAILTYDEETKQRLVQHWASPFESILLSTLVGKSNTLIFTDDPGLLEKEIQTNNQMITTHGRFLSYKPTKYFHLDDKFYSKAYLE